MDAILFLFLMGCIGALIGWVTNVAALKLLFRPLAPYVVPLLGWKVQGLIPKRQKDIAQAVSEIVSNDLITGRDIALSLGRQEVKETIANKIASHVQERVLLKMPPFIPRNLQISILEYVGKSLHSEVISFLDHSQAKLTNEDKIKDEIRQIVEEKILNFDLLRLEAMVFSVAKAELKHIEVIGGLLGFVIGIFQGMISLLLR